MDNSSCNNVSHIYKTVGDVVKQNLCHSCGVCAAMCPQQAISFNDAALPVLSRQCNTCGICLKVCSGLSDEGIEQPERDMDEQGFLCASTDLNLRQQSSSGGFVTELLRYMLKTRYVHGVVVTVADPGDPVRPVSIFATSEVELLRSCQSRYCLFPWGKILRDVIKKDKPFAVVGTACQLRSLRKAMKLSAGLRKNLRLMVGICCESNIELAATWHLLKIRSVKQENVKKIEYRHGQWPGVMAAFLYNGKKVVLSNRNKVEGAINFLKLTYGRHRCRFCCDVMSEVADVTVGDPWGRNRKGDLKYLNEAGYSAVLLRNRKVLSLIQAMEQESVVSVQEQNPDLLLGVQRFQVKRGMGRVARAINTAKHKRRPYPMLQFLNNQGEEKLHFGEKCSELFFQVGHTAIFRHIFLTLMFSPVGDVLASVNSWRKKVIFRLRNI